MATDNERREVAARLRHSWANVPDKNPVRHQLRVLFEIYSAVGLADDDDADAIDLFDRLADLIEPTCDRDTPQKVAEEMFGKMRHSTKEEADAYEAMLKSMSVEIHPVDRDALLALAGEMDAYSGHFSTGLQECTVQAWAVAIREALGVEHGD